MVTGMATMEYALDKQVISIKNEIAKLKHEKEYLEFCNVPHNHADYENVCNSLSHYYDLFVSLTGDINANV